MLEYAETVQFAGQKIFSLAARYRGYETTIQGGMVRARKVGKTCEQMPSGTWVPEHEWTEVWCEAGQHFVYLQRGYDTDCNAHLASWNCFGQPIRYTRRRFVDLPDGYEDPHDEDPDDYPNDDDYSDGMY
jgi:hypothetical protein